MVERLDALTSALATMAQPDRAGEFWVLRGREPILNRVRTMIPGAQRTVDLSLCSEDEDEVREVLALSRARGCRIFQLPSTTENNPGPGVILLVDGREGLVGTLAPVNRCQAVVSANQVLVTVLRKYFASQVHLEAATPVASTAADQQDSQVNWYCFSAQSRAGPSRSECHL